MTRIDILVILLYLFSRRNEEKHAGEVPTRKQYRRKKRVGRGRKVMLVRCVSGLGTLPSPWVPDVTTSPTFDKKMQLCK